MAVQPPRKDDAFLGRRGDKCAYASNVFEIHKIKGKEPIQGNFPVQSNLIQVLGKADLESLLSMIALIKGAGHQAGNRRDGLWRLDTDQRALPGGHRNTQIQKNDQIPKASDPNKVQGRERGGTTSATCVLVQVNADGKLNEGYNSAFGHAHEFSWRLHATIILSLLPVKTSFVQWECPKCGHSADSPSPLDKPPCNLRKVPCPLKPK